MPDIKKITQIKSEHFFNKGDLIVYLIILLLILSLFAYGFTGKGENALSGVSATYSVGGDDIKVFEYSFAEDEFKLLNKTYADVKNIEVGYSVTVRTEGDGINVIIIEKNGKVYIEEANCSKSADCTHFAPIESVGNVLICAPHHLVVEGIGEGEGSVVVG